MRRSTRGFTLLLILLVIIYVIAEVFDQSDLVQATTWILALLVFVVTLRALGATPKTVYVNLAVFATVLAIALVGLVVEVDAMIAPAGLAVTAYSFVAPVLIMRHIVGKTSITMDVIFGAVSVYVFLGIDFAVLYEIIARVDSAAFAATSGEVPSLFYFSFTTLTTVGYGDVTPVSDLARALTVVEALTGQILLVVIVARLVGMQIAQRFGRGNDS